MSFSLYYQAKRDRPLTGDEEAAVAEIVRHSRARYPFKRKVEDFGVYPAGEGAGVIFSGATKLPGNGPKALYDTANYWLKGLTEITRLLEGASWEVRFDDVDLILDPEEGWRFPTDEEYRQRYGR